MMFEQIHASGDRRMPSGATIDQGDYLTIPLTGGPVTIPKAVHSLPNRGNSRIEIRASLAAAVTLAQAPIGGRMPDLPGQNTASGAAEPSKTGEVPRQVLGSV